MLECGFESRLGLEFSGFSMWYFLNLVVRGFLRVPRSISFIAFHVLLYFVPAVFLSIHLRCPNNPLQQVQLSQVKMGLIVQWLNSQIRKILPTWSTQNSNWETKRLNQSRNISLSLLLTPPPPILLSYYSQMIIVSINLATWESFTYQQPSLLPENHFLRFQHLSQGHPLPSAQHTSSLGTSDISLSLLLLNLGKLFENGTYTLQSQTN